MTVTNWQGLIDTLVALGAVATIYFGYLIARLSVNPDSQQGSRVTRLLKFILPGTVPSIPFIAVGGLILYMAQSSGRDASDALPLLDTLATLSPRSSPVNPSERRKKGLQSDEGIILSQTGSLSDGSETLADETVNNLERALAEARENTRLSELAELVRNAGAQDELQALSDTTLDWRAYVNSQNDTNAFLRHMFSLETLGLANFATGGLQNAEPTRDGSLLANYLLDSLTVPHIPDESCPSESSSTLQVVEMANGSYRYVGRLPANTSAWFKLAVGQGTYDIQTTVSESPSEDIDTVIRLYNQDCRLVGFDDDEGVGTYSTLREELTGENSFLLVHSYAADVSGSYVLLVNLIEDEAPTENNSSPLFDRAAVEQLQPNGELVDGRLDGTLDIWFAFEIENSNSLPYRIETSPPQQEDLGVDTVIQLYADDQQTFLGMDDDSGGNGYSSLLEYLDTGTTYYVRVASYWGDPGGFRISVTQD